MGRPTLPLHDPGNHRPFARRSHHHAARRGSLKHPADPAGEHGDQRRSYTIIGDTTNLAIEYRFGAGDAALTRRYAAELIASKPDVILAGGSTAVVAAAEQTRSIPIVFVTTGPAVATRLVETFSRPGRNVTGFTSADASAGTKRIQFLKDAVPSLSTVTLLYNPTTVPGQEAFGFLERAASSLGITTRLSPVRDASELESLIAAAAKQPDGGLVVMWDIFTSEHRNTIIETANRHRVPAMYGSRYFAVNGGLLSFGADATDDYRRAADYIDRILRSESPADLPVQQPVKFEFVVNLRTAREMGLEVPALLIELSDEVIE